MTTLAVVLVVWVVLTLPASVLMGKCIARGLGPGPAPMPLPAQRSAVEDDAALPQGQTSPA